MTAQEFGAIGELFVYRKLAGAGLRVQFGGPADLVAEGVPVEVKAARPRPYRRGYRGYQFCLHRAGRRGVQAAVVVLLCYWDLVAEPVAFVIPADWWEIGERSSFRGIRGPMRAGGRGIIGGGKPSPT